MFLAYLCECTGKAIALPYAFALELVTLAGGSEVGVSKVFKFLR